MERNRFLGLLWAVFLSASCAQPLFAKDPLILVVKQESNELTVINAKTFKVIGNVTTGEKPHEVAVTPNGKLAYVSNYGGHDNSLSVIDIRRMKEVARIELEPDNGPHGLVITRDGKSLYATTERTRSVIELDLRTHEIKRSFFLEQHKTHMLAISPDEKILFTTNMVSHNVSVVDLVKGEVLRHIISGKGCEGVDVSPDGKDLWVTNGSEHSITVIDLETMRRVDKIVCQGDELRDLLIAEGMDEHTASRVVDGNFSDLPPVNQPLG